MLDLQSSSQENEIVSDVLELGVKTWNDGVEFLLQLGILGLALKARLGHGDNLLLTQVEHHLLKCHALDAC